MAKEEGVPSKEELLGILDEQEPEVNEEAQEPEYTEVEQKAMEMGWNPEGVEGKENLTAEEFVGRQPLYDDNRALKKQLKKVQDSVAAMKKMQDGIRQREREKTLAEQKQAKRVALENEDYDAVIEIDEAIAKTNSETDEDEAGVSNEAFEEWTEQNEWYHQDTVMKDYADTIGAGYFNRHPNAVNTEIFAYVEKEVKARFPEKFENPKRKQANPVEGASRGRTRAKSQKHKASDLPSEDRQIMRTLIRGNVMTEDEYLKDYFGD